MGLLYPYPIEENNDDDHIKVSEQGIALRTYGLPYIFWGYLLAIYVVIFFLGLAIHGPMMKMISGTDEINRILALIVMACLYFTPVFLLAMFFLEGRISKNKKTLILKKVLFGIPFWKKTIKLMDADAFAVEHYLSSPNYARIKENNELIGYQNRGYFQIFARDENGKNHLIDRHSQKRELQRLSQLLSKY